MKEHKVTCDTSSSNKDLNMAPDKAQPRPGGSGNIIVCLGLVGVAIAIAASVWYPVQKLSEDVRTLARKADGRTHSSQLEPVPDIKARDCHDVRARATDSTSGIYTIYPGDMMRGIQVFCDMDTDEGGWTVFQRRMDGSEDFKADWNKYQFGFGNLTGEFWLGNEYISLISSQTWYELRIDMEDFEDEQRYAKYQLFSVGPRDTEFKLIVGGYTGDVGDSFSSHNGHKFSTTDRDNDMAPGACAASFKGGWWYSNCMNACLNGQYHAGKHETNADGINWQLWKGYNYSLKRTTMMIRPL